MNVNKLWSEQINNSGAPAAWEQSLSFSYSSPFLFNFSNEGISIGSYFTTFSQRCEHTSTENLAYSSSVQTVYRVEIKFTTL